MNDTQFNSLNRAYQDAYNTYNQGVNGLGNNLTADQRAQQMEQFENRFNNSFNGAVDSNLTNGQARSRFDQLNRQHMGLNAFNNSAVQSQLNLTPQQRQQIRSLASQWRDQQGTNGGTPNYSQYSRQLNSILTPQQQQSWNQLTGNRFNFGASANGSAQNGVGTGAAAGTNGGAARGGTANNRDIEPYSSTAPPSGATGAVENRGGSTTGTGAGTSSGTATSGTGAGTTSGGTSGTGAGTIGGTSSSGTGAATGAAGTTGGSGK